MSGWAGQMQSFENQQKANNETASKKHFNNNKRNAKANHNRVLGENSSVRNKLQRLHNTGHKNRYYAKRRNQLNRGNVEGVLNKLTKHRARKNYGSTGARSARGELLNNTIAQLNREIRQNRETRTRNAYRLSGVNNPTNNNVRKSMNTKKSSKYSGMGQYKGGSKVKGRRVLKNGAHAGYVKQKDGTWKWSFLSKKRN